MFCFSSFNLSENANTKGFCDPALCSTLLRSKIALLKSAINKLMFSFLMSRLEGSNSKVPSFFKMSSNNLANAI